MVLNIFTRSIITSRVYDIIQKTPIQKSYVLSNNNNIFYKREDLLPIKSFKIRGAYNKIVNLSKKDKKKGIVACSSGNHAQGVAYSSNKLNINSTIIMPENTPIIKIEQVKKYCSDIILFGNNYNEAQEKAKEISKNENKVLIHPYDDELVIAGQGTIGLEILQQLSNIKIDKIFCPIGGGGLICGIGLIVRYLKPEVKIIGVQTLLSNSMKKSLDCKYIVNSDNYDIFCDAISVKTVGNINFELAENLIDDIILVSEGDIKESILDYYSDTRVILEGAGALSIAGFKKYSNLYDLKNENIVLIISGANLDISKYLF